MSTPTRLRGHVPQARFAAAAKQARSNHGGGYKRPEGLYDRLKLGVKPIWLRISPDQIYSQRLYDKSLKAVIETGHANEDGIVEYPARPWLEIVQHFVPSRKRGFTCSSGAARDQPCRGCANREHYYDHVREREKALGGMRDDAARKAAPIQASTRYAMGVTVLEKILEMPLTDNKGKPRKNKEGKDLMTKTPAPLSGYSPQQQDRMPGEFGMNYHFGFGPVHLSHLSNLDTDLYNYCANCAQELVAQDFHCASCEAVVYSAKTALSRSDLRGMRETVMQCSHCRHEGLTIPAIACSGCESPEEGSVLAFDLRLRIEPDPADDKKSTLICEGHRVPDYATLFADNPEVVNRIYELVYHPLDVAAIFAPDSLDAQAWALPEDLKGIDPSYHIKKKKLAVSYSSGAADEEHADAPIDDDSDPDQMTFDE